MTRLVTLLLSGLLALLAVVGVEAKTKNKDNGRIHLYQWSDDDCLTNPDGANVDFDMVGQCVNINARSIRAVQDEKRPDTKGKSGCRLISYTQSDCSGPAMDHLNIPNDLGTCQTSTDGLAIRSVGYSCDPELTLSVSTITTTIPTWVTVQDRHHQRVASGSSANVWMSHPWALSPLCYSCWTKKPGDLSWVKCVSRPGDDSKCDGNPPTENNPGTTTFTVTATETTSSTSTSTIVSFGDSYTTTTTSTIPKSTTIVVPTTYTIDPPPVVVTGFSTSSGPISPSYTITTIISESLVPIPPTSTPLGRRSWHRRVMFRNPFSPFGDLFCADAEWEKRGKPNTEIRLQEVHPFDSNCDDAVSIDLPPPVIEFNTVSTETLTVPVETTVTEIAHVHTTATAYTTAVKRAEQSGPAHSDL